MKRTKRKTSQGERGNKGKYEVRRVQTRSRKWIIARTQPNSISAFGELKLLNECHTCDNKHASKTKWKQKGVPKRL